jgi:hypothetical protein
MDVQQREYDRFGPWAIEISEQDPLPPLFVPHVTRPETPLLSVKIPRHLERRNARPGMDLYDYLVTLYEDELIVLQRLGRDVRRDTCRLEDVQHLRVSRCLLRGNIHLGLPGRPHDLPYNTVSDDLMLRLVALIRQRYRRTPGPTPLGELQVEDDVLSFYFEHVLAAERRAGTGMHLLAAQGTVPVATQRVGALRRLAFRAVDKRLMEAMHFSDGRELMVMTRGKAYAYRWEVEYGVETTYIPLRNLSAATWSDDRGNEAVNLVLRTGGGDTACVFARENDSVEAYAAYLAAVAAPAHPAVTSAAGLHAA